MKLKVKSNATHVFRCSGINILPGVNYIESDKFATHPSVIARVKAGLLVVEECLPEQQKDFASITAKDLIKDIKDILDVKVLENIKQNEKRVSVIQAVDAQIALIKQ